MTSNAANRERASRRPTPSYSQIPQQAPGRTASPRTLLPLAVAFLSGWAIMQIEILGGRVLAPYFGYSIYQWGALIGVVMTALAIGYAVGGRVGDRPVAGRFLAAALAVSMVYIGGIPWLADAALPAFRSLGPAWGAVFASIALLGVPSLLLATTSPIVIRMTATDRIAGTAGRVYAVSTVGSIAGTFFTSFLVIPEFGTRLGHYLCALLVAVALAGLLAQRRQWRGMAGALVLAGILYPWPPQLPDSVIFRTESVHNIIEVHDTARARALYLNYTTGVQTIEVKGESLTGEYFDLFLLGPHLNGGRKILMLGTAGGVALKELAAVYPDADITGVDLDPAVIKVAREYFGLKDVPRIRLVAEDARWFLYRTRDRYDVVAVDLYVTGTIPFFTATREFFALARDRMTENGVLIINVLSRRRGEARIAPFVRTLQDVFPNVYATSFGNYMLIATRQPTTFDAMRRRLEADVANVDLAHVLARARPTFRVIKAGAEVRPFTDDLNDVELRSFDLLHGRD
ncbi:MAG: fused MFS/spermidine synthase [Rhodospirillaceae bacterium]|nr:fused MFS/spermidine synthase [Rhodospirillaceae bacterium]